MRRTLLLAIVCMALGHASSAHAQPIEIGYAQKAIGGYIEKNYTVAVGPRFGRCTKLAANKVRCEVSFKAGLYWRCGRVSIRQSGHYDYFTARLPIGC